MEQNALKTKYQTTVQPALKQQFHYRSVMEIPKIVKVMVNIGAGEAAKNHKVLQSAMRDLALITGQKPVATAAKKSIANFKLRAGMNIGCKVTLRREKMWDFLAKLIWINLPRVRDFRGLSPKGFDQHGNYTFGIKEQIIFPEINYDQIDKIRGLNVTIVTSAKTDQEAFTLLRLLGFPLRKVKGEVNG